MRQTLRWLLLCLALPFGTCALWGGDAGPAPAQANAVELKIYDVRALCEMRQDFQGPQASLAAFSNAAEANPFAAPSTKAVLNAADLAQVIQERLLAEDFGGDPSCSILETGGKLVVMQRPAVHVKIDRILKGFGQRLGKRFSVQGLELAVEPANVWEWLGKAGSVVPQATVDGMLKADGALVAAPQFSAFNGQRACVVAGRSWPYLADLDLSGATYDPVIRAQVDGIIFEGRPQLDSSGAALALDLRFSRSAPKGEARKVAFEGLVLERDNQTIKRYKTKAAAAENEDEAKEEKKGAKEEDGEVEEEVTNNSAARVIAKGGAALELPAQALRTFETQVRLPVSTWVVAGMLDPVPGAPAGAAEAKALLVLVRCDVLYAAQANR